jgi:hypothetical protein
MAPIKVHDDSEQTGKIWNIMSSEILSDESAVSNLLGLEAGEKRVGLLFE